MPSIDEIAAKYGANTGDKYDTLAKKYGGASGQAAMSIDPTEGMTTTDKVLAGVGKSMVDTVRGVGQLARDYVLPSGLADSLGLPTQADADETKRRDAALMNTGAGTAGYLGGTIASALFPAGVVGVGAKYASKVASLPAAVRAAASVTGTAADAFINPSTYKAAAAAGALQGVVQPLATGDSRGFNTLVGVGGGLLGNGVANSIGRIAQPFKNALDDVSQKAVDTFRNAGIPLDAAQLTGSPLLARIKSSFSDNPFTMGAQADMRGKQQTAFNSAVLRTIGQDAPAATQGVMSDAANKINGVFGDVLSRNNMNVDDALLSRLANIQGSALEMEKKPVSNIINRISGAVDSNNQIPGQTAYNFKKDLDLIASTPDTVSNHFVRNTRSALMDGINNSLNGADQVAFADARGQFRNMKQIEPAIDKEGTGNISAPRLAGIFGQKSNRAQSVYGMGDQTLVDLAQSGKQLLQDKTPNSGSIARMAMQIAPSLIAGGASGASDGDWVGAAKTAAEVAALPKLAQFLMNNRVTSNYLANGLKPGALRGLLDMQESVPMVGSVMRQSLPAEFRTGLLD